MSLRTVAVAVVALWPLGASLAIGAPPDDVRFGRDVQPILARSCLPCHGFDPSTRQMNLRLDTFEYATSPRGGRPPAIVPGAPDDSLILARIDAPDPADRMPPEGEPLTPEEVEIIRRWIADGAAYETHWSHHPLRPVAPPAVDDGAWRTNAIDRFIRARIDDAGLEPAPRVDRRALLRRLSFDLTGLPPTFEQTEAFVADEAPDAVARQVDRLLDSPRFGERWARHWLDLMRYAETYGHEWDYPIHEAWRYRDYVIRAFNEDVPYDDLIREHLAGDLLPSPRRHPVQGFNESVLGTGFWWLSQGTHGPTDVRHDEAERIDNQLDVMSKAFLATTVSCARCHDHKFDPITQRDYYGLTGYLQSSRRRLAYLDPHQKIASAVDAMRAADATIRARFETDGRAALADAVGRVDWEAVAAATPVDDPAHPFHLLTKTPGERFAAVAQTAEAHAAFADATRPVAWFEPDARAEWRPDGWAFGVGTPRTAEPGELLAPGSAVRLCDASGFDSAALAPGLEGTLRSPTFEIESARLFVRTRGRGRVRLIIDGYHIDEFNALLFETVIRDVNGDHWTWVTHHLDAYVGHRAYYEIIDDHPDAGVAVSAMRWGETTAPAPMDPPVAGDVDAYVAAMQGVIDGRPDPHGGDLLHRLITDGHVAITPIEKDAAAHFADAAASCPRPVRALAMVDGTAEDAVIALRGDHRQPGPPAPRGFLSILEPDPPPPALDGSGREQLAAMILASDNPFPARVMVNRVWRHLFGVGLVETPDDFGLLGEAPSHPELLDHLAERFRTDLDWSVKALIREIVLSRTYRSGGGASSAQDPDHRLLAVRPPRRLDGEALRDAILSVSGELDLTMYGPPVATHLTPFMTGRGRPRDSGPLDGDGRRSIYLAVRRNFLTPMLQVFDTPVPHSTIGERNRSNVPAQSLTLLNDPFVVEQARACADRLREAAPDDPRAQIDTLYRRALGRRPSETEVGAALDFLAGAPDLGATDPLADLAHVIFNLKEFSFIE